MLPLFWLCFEGVVWVNFFDFVTKTTVLFCGFLAVVGLAQALPVVAIPEQCFIVFVRDDVIDYLCGDHSALAGAVHAEWV